MATIDGTAGDDDLDGTDGNDVFVLTDGGEDTARGGSGNDVFDLGGTLDAGDHLDGGAGKDAVVLHGDYSAGLAFTAAMMTGIEEIDLTRGFDYVLTGLGQIAAKGFALFARGVPAGTHILADASDATQLVRLHGGQGPDTLIGGAGDDRLYGGGGGRGNSMDGGAGNDRFYAVKDGDDHMDGGDGADAFVFTGKFTARDTVIGGEGADTLYLDHIQPHPIIFGAQTLQGVEAMVLVDGAYGLTLDDANVAAGQTLNVSVNGATVVRVDGSAETDGTFNMTAGGEPDTLIGGAGDDTLTGGGGGDKLVGGLGGDLLQGRADSAERFVYLSTDDSTPGAADLIAGLDDSDVIDLKRIDANLTKADDQAFHLVSAFTGHAGELVVSYDAGHDLTSIMGDVDGDSQADLLITVQGGHPGFTGFTL